MKLHRKQKESEKVDLFYASLISRFHQVMFGVDHDDPNTPNADIFSLFNKAWIGFCEDYNKKCKHHAANPQAFYDYAIKRDI
jgi:hypothetical protein